MSSRVSNKLYPHIFNDEGERKDPLPIISGLFGYTPKRSRGLTYQPIRQQLTQGVFDDISLGDRDFLAASFNHNAPYIALSKDKEKLFNCINNPENREFFAFLDKILKRPINEEEREDIQSARQMDGPIHSRETYLIDHGRKKEEVILLKKMLILGIDPSPLKILSDAMMRIKSYEECYDFLKGQHTDALESNRESIVDITHLQYLVQLAYQLYIKEKKDTERFWEEVNSLVDVFAIDTDNDSWKKTLDLYTEKILHYNMTQQVESLVEKCRSDIGDVLTKFGASDRLRKFIFKRYPRLSDTVGKDLE